MKIDLFSDSTHITEDNFIDYIHSLAQHKDVVDTHREWEKLDQEWKDTTKDISSTNNEISFAAMKVRESKKRKDIIHDQAARLALKATSRVPVIEEYDKDILGSATIIDDVEEGSAEWLNLRTTGVGGSSLSELLGFHWKSRSGYMHYMTDEELDEHWMDAAVEKSTTIHHAQDNSSGVLFRGHSWEPALIARYALQNDTRVAVTKATWQGVLDIQTVNIDGIILNGKGEPEGILECKTSSRPWTWNWGIPIHYRCQVLWYLKATGLEYADVLVKFDDGSFDTHRIYYDETVDGTEKTYPLDYYIPELQKRWGKVKEYKNNHSLLWEDHPDLRKEKDSVDGIVIPGEQYIHNEDLQYLVESPVYKIDLLYPYKRMDNSFTKIYSVHTKEGSYMKQDYPSPCFYETTQEYKKIKNIDSIIDNQESYIALDNATYHLLSSFYKKHDIINLSAIRRIYDNNPGEKDFSSIEESLSWLNKIKEKS